MNVVEDVVGIDPKVGDLVVVHLSGHVRGAVQDAHLDELGHDDDNDKDGDIVGAVLEVRLDELRHDDDNDEDGCIGGALTSLVMMIQMIKMVMLMALSKRSTSTSLVMMIRIMKMVMLVALSKKFTLTSLVSKNLGILKAKARRRAGRTYMTKWSLKEFFTFALLYCKGRLMAKHLVMVMVKQLNNC